MKRSELKRIIREELGRVITTKPLKEDTLKYWIGEYATQVEDRLILLRKTIEKDNKSTGKEFNKIFGKITDMLSEFYETYDY